MREWDRRASVAASRVRAARLPMRPYAANGRSSLFAISVMRRFDSWMRALGSGSADTALIENRPVPSQNLLRTPLASQSGIDENGWLESARSLRSVGCLDTMIGRVTPSPIAPREQRDHHFRPLRDL